MKIRWFALFFLVTTVTQKAAADEVRSIVAVNRSVDLAYALTHTYYNEPNGGYALITNSNYFDYDSGTTQGVNTQLSWMTDLGWYAHLEYAFSTGKLGYTGYNQPAFTPANATTRSTTNDYSVKLGRGFPLAVNKWMFTPYLAFGSHHWVREVGEGTVNDLTHSYNHLYYGFGAMMQYSPMDRWVFTGDAMIGRTYRPWINAPSVGLDHTDLGPGPIYKFRLEADYLALQWLHFFAALDYTGFSYGQTELQFNANAPAGVLEPGSQTQIYEISTGVRFTFDIPQKRDIDIYWIDR